MERQHSRVTSIEIEVLCTRTTRSETWHCTITEERSVNFSYPFHRPEECCFRAQKLFSEGKRGIIGNKDTDSRDDASERRAAYSLSAQTIGKKWLVGFHVRVSARAVRLKSSDDGGGLCLDGGTQPRNERNFFRDCSSGLASFHGMSPDILESNRSNGRTRFCC